MALSDIQFKRSGATGDCLGGAIHSEGAGEQGVAGAMPSGIVMLSGSGNPEGGRTLEFQPATAMGEPKVVRVTVYDDASSSSTVRVGITLNGSSGQLTDNTRTAADAAEKLRILVNGHPDYQSVSAGDVVVGYEADPSNIYGAAGDYSYFDITGNDATDFTISLYIAYDYDYLLLSQETIQPAEGPHSARVRFDNGAWVDVSADGTYTLHSGTDNGFVVIAVTAASLPTTKTNTPLDIRTPEADLFSNISGQQGLTGFDEYLCVYIVNGDSVIHDFTFYIPTQPANATLEIGLGTAAANGTEQTITDINTVPTGVTFAAPVDSGTSTITQTLASGEHKALWIHRALAMGNYATVSDDLSKIAVNIL